MKTKKILASLLAVAMLFTMFTFTASASTDVWDGSVDTSWYTTDKTEFEISTAAQLAGLAKLVNDKTAFWEEGGYFTNKYNNHVI